MTQRTPEEIRDKLSETLYKGNAEEQVSDRRQRKFSPSEIIEASKELAAIESSTGPFIRVGFKGRPV